MKKIINILFCTFLSSSILAYPISPRPLRLLVKESELIIRGKVIEVGHLKGNDKKPVDIWERDYAVIQVTEVIQGQVKEKMIKVFFCATMICPAPGTFYENEDVLTFLDKQEKGEGYTVPALSYGVKHHLNEAAFTAYKNRIKEMQEILNEDEEEQEYLIMEWLVKCAEDKNTRWEGTYELSPTSDFMSYYDRNKRVRKDIFLSKSQRKRLFDAFMQTDSLNYSDLGLADMIKGVDDCRVLNKLKKALTNFIISAEKYYYLYEAHAIMYQIVYYSGDTELKDIHTAISKFSFWEEKDKTMVAKLLQQFINNMKETNCNGAVTGADRFTG